MKKTVKEVKPDLQIEELKQQLDDCTNRWKRAMADYQNLEKRARDDKVNLIKFALKRFIEKLLDVVDDLEKANEHLKDQGLGLALKKLNELLKSEGVEKIETEGKAYEIETMEALQMVDGEVDNQVVKEHRPGYLMYGSVLRPAQVTVSKKINTITKEEKI